MRIAQITDLHARKALPNSSCFHYRESRRVPELFEKALDLLKNDYKPDILLVTGDIIDVPFYVMAERNEKALRSAREDYLTIQRAIFRSKIPSVVLAGNHDDERIFHEIFTDLSSIIHTAGSDIIQVFPWDRERKDHTPFRNFTAYSFPPKRDGLLIHVQHYVITPRLDDIYPHTYKNAEQIIERNRSLGVNLSISGHYHPGHSPIREGSTIYCIGAAFCEAPFPIYIYDLDPTDGSLSLIVRTLIDQEPLSKLQVISSKKALRVDESSGRDRPLVVYSEEPFSEKECDELWTILSNRGLTVAGVYSAPDEETRAALYRRTPFP